MAKFNLLDTLKGITEGTFNSLVLNEQVEEIANERFSICRNCPFNSEVAKKNGQKIIRPDEHCMNCGCNLHLKTRAMSQHCPLDKWLAVTSVEEGSKIDEIIKNTENERKTQG